YTKDVEKQPGRRAASGDVDGDGHLDLTKTNFIEDTANLYRNNGDGSFEDYVHSSGMGVNTKYMGWGVAFLDYDNDARPDIFMANGHIYVEIERLMREASYREARLLYRN